MRRFLFTIFLSLTISLYADTFDSANMAVANNDYDKAVTLYEKACYQEKNSEACFELELRYLDVVDLVSKDNNTLAKNAEAKNKSNKAKKFRKSLEQPSKFGLTFNKAQKAYDSKDYTKAHDLFFTACFIENIPKACYKLSMMYLGGKGVSASMSKYNEMSDFYKSKRLNLYKHGLRYQMGEGVEQNYTEAVKYYTKACDNDSRLGCYNLGMMYYNGQEIKKDYPKALELFRKTCNSWNDAYSCYNLGYMYLTGDGAEIDLKMAKYLFEKACEEGYSGGCENSTKMKGKGKGK